MTFKDLKYFPDWCDWLKLNIERGCNPVELMDSLVKNEFSLTSIKEMMGGNFPKNMDDIQFKNEMNKRESYLRLSQISLTKLEGVLNVQKVPSGKLQLYQIEDFLSEEECDQIMHIAGEKLRPSTLTVQDEDKYFRTSQTSDLGLLNHPFIKKIDEKISSTLGINSVYAEGTQAQRYETGQEFKMHTDYFQPGTDEYQNFAKERGNRTWTFMIYLNNVLKGGGTRFFAIDKTIMPKKGMAVVWNNLLPDGAVNADTLHSGLPVEEGFKFIITKWYRERPAPAI